MKEIFTKEFIYLILGTLFSGIIGTFITNLYYNKTEKRRIKIETLKNLVGYRYEIVDPLGLGGTNFSKALNEIFVVFNDSKLVLDKLNSYSKDGRTENLNSLIKEMCKDLKFDLDHNVFDSNFLSKPFFADKTKK